MSIFWQASTARSERGQGTVEYIGVVAVVIVIVAAVVAMTTPVGGAVIASMTCAFQDIGSVQETDAACEPGEVEADDEDDREVDLPGGLGPDTALRCQDDWEFCQPEKLEDGETAVCLFPLGTLGCGVEKVDEEDLPPYDPEDDCTTDDSCEGVWDGAMEPGESEGEIEQVGWFECNFNILGWYPNDNVRFSWEANSLSGAGAATPSVCVDGPGTINIDQEGVERFDAGEHTGWFIYKGDDGYEYKHYFEEGETSYFDPSSTVYEVHID
ncbi:hypothetical protein GCM10010413_04410 [Promicromonospora sukumoe]